MGSFKTRCRKPLQDIDRIKDKDKGEALASHLFPENNINHQSYSTSFQPTTLPFVGIMSLPSPQSLFSFPGEGVHLPSPGQSLHLCFPPTLLGLSAPSWDVLEEVERYNQMCVKMLFPKTLCKVKTVTLFVYPHYWWKVLMSCCKLPKKGFRKE